MAQKVITRAFRGLEIINLDDLSVGSLRIEQAVQISHDANFTIAEASFEDSLVPNVTALQRLEGNITLSGYLEDQLYPHYSSGSQVTDKFFKLSNNYLIRFLGVAVNAAQLTTKKMVYGRWTGQLVQLPAEQRANEDEIPGKEIQFRIFLVGSKNYDEDAPYIAAADADPGPADAAPTADYNPVWMHTFDPTPGATLAQAETSFGTLTNPI